MEPIELTARREALGLGIYALADYLDVRHQNVGRWELGKNPPRTWDWIDAALTKLENYQEELATSMITTTEENYQEGGELGLVTFTTDDHYWDWMPQAGNDGIPVGVHRAATARAALLLRTKFDKPVLISSAPRADQF